MKDGWGGEGGGVSRLINRVGGWVGEWIFNKSYGLFGEWMGC